MEIFANDGNVYYTTYISRYKKHVFFGPFKSKTEAKRHQRKLVKLLNKVAKNKTHPQKGIHELDKFVANQSKQIKDLEAKK